MPAGQSIIFRFELEISLRMLAHRADFRRALAYHDVAAVGALPDHIAVAGEDEAAFHIGEQLAVTLFVFFFDLADRMAKEAKEEGFDHLAYLFEAVGKIEKEHEERYNKLLKNLEEGKVFARDGEYMWICSNCGHIHFGKEAPQVCPVCAHPQAYFELRAENY